MWCSLSGLSRMVHYPLHPFHHLRPNKATSVNLASFYNNERIIFLSQYLKGPGFSINSVSLFYIQFHRLFVISALRNTQHFLLGPSAVYLEPINYSYLGAYQKPIRCYLANGCDRYFATSMMLLKIKNIRTQRQLFLGLSHP